jgi:Zn-dependent protease
LENTLNLIAAELVVLILCLSFHEAAHAWSANGMGDPTARLLGRLTLNPLSHIDLIGTIVFPVIAMLSSFPLIGWAKPVPVNPVNLRHPRRDFAMVAAAGPASNVLLAVVFWVVLALLATEEATGSLTMYILRRAVEMNLMLAVFNLIPVPPLDGGNILAGLVPESAAQTLDRVRPFGIFILYALLLSGGLFYIWSPINSFLVRYLP